MQRQVKQLDFSGQNIYVGLDTHKKQITVTILGERLSHKTFSQPPRAEVLVSYLKRNFPGATYYAAYEAGFSGFWLQESLQAQGVNCIVVNPADVPTKDKERRQKRDLLDSRKIARSLRNGELEPIYVPTQQGQQDRSLVRTRYKIMGNLTRCKNRIKSLLSFYHIEFPEEFAQRGTHWSRRFMDWLKGVDLAEQSGTLTLGLLIEEAEFLRQLLLKATRQIRHLSRTGRYARLVNLLIKIPGIGVLTAMIILTELEKIGRFKGLDQLCSYVGLIPTVAESGEKERIGDITQRGNKLVRSMLVESSWVAIRKDPALTIKYNELCGRMSGNRAIIRIARKLLNRIRYVLIHQQEYELAVVK